MFIRESGFSDLSPVNEHGELERGTITEGAESVRLSTFGKVLGNTRQAIVNDDLGALSDIPRKLGDAAARFEADKLVALLISNPTMGDEVALFHATHGNLGTAAAIGVNGLTEARQMMRAQTDDAGFLIAVVPKFLVVGPEEETNAEPFLATIAPTKTSDTQPIKLTLVVEPRLTGSNWFVVDLAVGRSCG